MTEPTNAPAAHPEARHLRPQSVDAGRGLAWWTEAWHLFTKGAGIWIVMALILLIILIVLGFIPVLGGLAISLLLPVFTGGWMLAARKVDAGGMPEVGDLFGGFRESLSSLAVLGALMLAASLLIGVAAMLLGAGAVLDLVSGEAHHRGDAVVATLSVGLFGLFVALALGLIMAMAIWFAPALIVLRGVPPARAMRASLAACLKNVLPFLVYSVLYIAAAIVASIPFGLGWIVLIPVLMLTVYVSYRDIFGS